MTLTSCPVAGHPGPTHLPCASSAPTSLPSAPARYALAQAGHLTSPDGPVPASLETLNRALRDHILAPEFSCVAARSSVNTNCYALGHYPSLTAPGTASELAADLRRFTHDQDRMQSGFTSMIAVFSGPDRMDEHAFERHLWALLSQLRALDTSPYSPEVSSDSADPRYGFSMHGRAFFVIGVHPGSSRLARQFPFPALVFNAHRQFQALRDTGRFDRLQSTIRQREMKWQGNLNPNLANHGEASEARQYSGRAVEPDWQAPLGRCPFGHGA